LLVVYTAAAFFSALLLFAVQPMAAKWLLPSLGGSPSVWITCMLFFQAALLAGYAYAHAVTRTLGRKWQMVLHLALLAVPLFLLPLELPEASADAVRRPVIWLVSALVVWLGAPLLVLSSSAPLLQRWFVSASAWKGRDPYFLYAASNLGSLIALVAYPLLLEPSFPVSMPGDRLLPPSFGDPSQNLLWSLGYILFAILCLACGFYMLRGRSSGRSDAASTAGPGISWKERLLWITLAAVPSSAMLGTTLVITTDIAAVPLLWIAPLALYLLTYILAFARPGAVTPAVSGIALGLCCIAVAAMRWIEYRPHPLLNITLTLITLLVLAYVCHDRLSRRRPEAGRLTEFYLYLALGGMLGGLFNAVVAPELFDSVLEYPLVLVLALLLRPVGKQAKRRLMNVVMPAALLLVLFGLIALAKQAMWPEETRLVVGAAAGCGLALIMIPYRLRFALALSILLAVAAIETGHRGNNLLKDRTFYGVLRVERMEGKPFQLVGEGGSGETRRVDSHDLFHGTTRHGRQMLDPEMGRWGASYYHPTGPVGKLFRTFRRSGRFRDVGLIGLGVGALAAYGEHGQTFKYYEIDPAVIRIARDPELFTYLHESKARIVTLAGDGRILLSRERDASFDLVVVDGFTSDAIPVHLMTREAILLYFEKLRPAGLLALHLTNEHFDLLPVVRSIAGDLGLAGMWWDDRLVSVREEVEGKSRSLWAVLARDEPALEAVRAGGAWERLTLAPDSEPWTDTFSSPLKALRR
jgi:hypothetical protein